jgi:hypothetical protein
MDPVEMFPYKLPAMQKVFDAFRALLLRAADAGGDEPSNTAGIH